MFKCVMLHHAWYLQMGMITTKLADLLEGQAMLNTLAVNTNQKVEAAVDILMQLPDTFNTMLRDFKAKFEGFNTRVGPASDNVEAQIALLTTGNALVSLVFEL